TEVGPLVTGPGAAVRGPMKMQGGTWRRLWPQRLRARLLLAMLVGVCPVVFAGGVILSNAGQIDTRGAILAGALLLAVTGILWIVIGRLLAPFQGLIQAAGAFEAGHWSRRAEEDAAGETGELARFFNRMAAQLEAAQHNFEDE